MATPTVHYDEGAAATDSFLVSVWMPALQALMFAAGWDLVYADSDAIGSSLDPSIPAWDKTPAINTDAGIAVYQMPANDHDTRWFVRLRPGWATATNRAIMRGVTVGATHDGTGGVSGPELTVGTASAQTDNRAWQAAASEDGLFIHAAGSNPVLVHVERLRLPNGVVTDDVVAAASYYTQSHVVLNAASGAISTSPPLVLAEQNGVSQASTSGPGVTTSRDGATVVVLGPYYRGAYPLFGPPRLYFLASESEVAAGVDREMTIDGGSKTYRAWGVSLSGWRRLLVATE